VELTCRNVETPNRCRAVTDKSQSAWQKALVRCNGCALKSVCREVHGVALAAGIPRVYRPGRNPRVQCRDAIHLWNAFSPALVD